MRATLRAVHYESRTAHPRARKIPLSIEDHASVDGGASGVIGRITAR